jgi:hypothetical protein
MLVEKVNMAVGRSANFEILYLTFEELTLDMDAAQYRQNVFFLIQIFCEKFFLMLHSSNNKCWFVFYFLTFNFLMFFPNTGIILKQRWR